MGKMRHRIKGKSKGKRWPKGHSSDSNPAFNKFRSSARSGVFQPAPATSRSGGLTEEALSKHDAVLSVSELGTIEDAQEDDAITLGSLGQESFRTFATDFTQCTVPSFSKLLSTVRKESAVYKEMLAILAAITDVVKARGGKETITEYFGSLMSVLETVDSSEGVQLQAVCHLLSLGIRHMPRPVLVANFSPFSKLLMTRLEAALADGTVLLLKSLIECVAFLLRAQPASVWAEPSTLQMYGGILSFVIHTRPKVRRAGQRAVVSVLLGSACTRPEAGGAGMVHPAAANTAQFCRQQMEQCGGSGRAVTTLHLLALLRSILVTFPRQQLKLTIETVLKLMTGATPMVRRSSLLALQSLLSAKPSAQTLPASMNAQLISALHDFQPPLNDAQPLTGWLGAMHAGCANLYSIDNKLGLSHLPRFFSAAAHCWTSSKQEVRVFVSETLDAMLDTVVAQLGPADSAVVQSCFQPVQLALNYQYLDAWPLVLRTMARFFQVYGAHGAEFMGPCLVGLVELRDTEQFSYTAELETAVGAAVSAMGPRAVLKYVPLQIAGDDADDLEFSRSWLLPVMRTSIRNTELAFFVDYFLPLSQALRRRAEEFAGSDDKRLCRIYQTLELQVWDLLPGFCTGALDVPVSLKRLARVLGSALTDRSDLRLVVMSSLRQLIAKSCQEPAAQAEVARFAKNYLPILFNLYMTLDGPGSEQGQRTAAYETVVSYLTVAEPQLVGSLVERAMEKLSGPAEMTDEARVRVLDLLRAALPHLESERVAEVWKRAAPYMDDDQTLSQKAAYRMLEELCRSQDMGCITFVQENYMDLMMAIKNAQANTNSAAKASRLLCLDSLLDHLDNTQSDFIATILPEAVLCCKEHNEKTRSTAFKLLVKIGNTLVRWQTEVDGDDGGGEAMRAYMKLLLAGLTGSSKMIAATILAMAQVIHQFRDIFPADLMELTVENVSLLLTTTREPVEACLSLTKALVFAVPPQSFARHLPRLIKSLSAMTDDCKRHFRQKVRDLLTLMVRKYGYDLVHGLVPSSDATLQKRLKNIKKIERRKEANRELRRQQKAGEEPAGEQAVQKTRDVEEILRAAEGSSDEEPETGPADSGAAYIREDAESIVDLLDPRASRHVTATRPEQGAAAAERRRRRHQEYAFNEEGKLVIPELDQDSGEDSGGDSDSGDEPEEFLEAIRNTAGHRKRKLDTSSQVSGSTAAGVREPAAKYRAGGGGIHRPNPTESVRSGRSAKTARTDASRQRPGAEYASRKGRGDVKRAGRPDPYAYVPLKKSALNKRKKAKLEGRYKNLVRGAQKGAKKGTKGRAKSRNR